MASDPLAPMVKAVSTKLKEDPHEFRFVIHDSFMSMTADAVDIQHPPATITRMTGMRQATGFVHGLADRIDGNGVQLRFFSKPDKEYPVPKGASVEPVFAEVCPGDVAMGMDSITCTMLDLELGAYVNAYSKNPAIPKLVLLMMTGGNSTDRAKFKAVDPSTGAEVDGIKAVLIKWCHELNRLEAPMDQVGVQFVQIGMDEAARVELAEADNLNIGGRDMADTVYFHPAIPIQVLVLKAVAGSVSKDLDDERMMANLIRMFQAASAPAPSAPPAPGGY